MPNKACVVVNPARPESWSQEIGPGEYTIGRGAENQVPIDHPSVDLAHCSIRVENGSAVLTDLESSTGTYVDGRRIAREGLLPGTRFRVGEVELEFQASADSQPAAEPGLLELGPGTRCKNHRQALARHYCEKCDDAYCELCVHTRHTKKFCRRCGSECRQVRVRPVLPEARPSFWKVLPGIFAYPFRGNGPYIMILGVLMYLAFGWLPLVGLVVTGYMFNYCKEMVVTSAAGEPEVPDWPEFANWWDGIAVPYFHLFALTALTFAPAILLAMFLPWEDWRRYVLVGGAAAFGAFLAPMGMLTLSMFDTVTALNPVTLIWSIARIFKEYVVAALAFEATLVVSSFSDTLIALVIPVPFLPAILAGFASFYLFCLAMRIVGLLYWSCEERLGWHAH